MNSISAHDRYALGTLALVPADADGDGMADSWETNYLDGTAATAGADADADGLSNWQEFIAGTHPQAGTSVFQLASLVLGDEHILSWRAETGRLYDVERIADGQALLLAGDLPATQNAWTDASPPAAASVLYRARVRREE